MGLLPPRASARTGQAESRQADAATATAAAAHWGARAESRGAAGERRRGGRYHAVDGVGGDPRAPPGRSRLLPGMDPLGLEREARRGKRRLGHELEKAGRRRSREFIKEAFRKPPPPARCNGRIHRQGIPGWSLGVCERVVCEDVWPRRSTPKRGCKCVTVERCRLRWWWRREGQKPAAGVRASVPEAA